ncbi:MAG: transketolase C-terminal domain-containing protein [Verrucomicrobiota bacterium]
MAVDTSPAVAIEAPPLKALELKSKLAPTPEGALKYAKTVKTAHGTELSVGDPDVTRGLVALMNVHAVHGGAACHWGGPAALAEIMASIHGIMFAAKTADAEWYDKYNFVNDAGHTENGIYALRANYGYDSMTFETLRGFRSIESKFTGHGESHLNPEGVLLSNGPLGSSLPQAQGLAMADKVSGNDRVTFCVVSDGAAMEGEAKESFAAIPGLAGNGQLNPFVLIISDNDTKLSGRITADSFSMQPTFQAMEKLGWNVIELSDGNNLQASFTAIEQAIAAAQADPSKPVFLWAKTVKGYGVKATEEHAAGGHGFPLKGGGEIEAFVDEIFKGQTPEEFKNWASELRETFEKMQAEKKAKAAASDAPPVKKEKVQAGLARGAIKASQAGFPVFSLSADLAGSTGISPFQKGFADRSIDLGIAESNMVSAAAGMSKQGYIPIVDTFAQFGVTKGNLPLTMAVLSQSPVIAMFSHCGFQDAADGASHQASTYLAAVSAIPHTVVVACSCSNEAEAFMYQAIERIAEDRQAGKEADSVLFFVGRENYPQDFVPGTTYAWGKAQIIEEGSDVTFVASGVLLAKALKAAEELKAEGKSATVINNPFINRPDLETIGSAVEKTGGKLVTIEDHQVKCGMGAQVIHELVQSGLQLKAKSLGIPGTFGQSAYLADQLYDRYGLSPKGLIEAFKQLS